ncbi:Bacterial SH3 domain protein [Sporotomaculum syntrophicum]|uniref:Bacterial SH3 domain protein n=1 Tax=Sporotomaculum syntrophicum TaxID=182264 RepID=A0A9D2WRC4_9FIRM|nr:SH3 domain-containing protein [Sporotomaculum syntrophicum]KAF1085943.1 Bacterial SH3 domain protein [Sporotomaculum syntrophicum]
MWSWLIILLITLCCFFCFLSAVQLELKRPKAKIWIILTCLMIFAVVGTLLSVPSPVSKEYSYEPKPAKIELKYLEPIEEELPEQDEPQNQTIDGKKDIDSIDYLTEAITDTQAEETPSQEKRVSVMVSELNVRLRPQYNAYIIGNVQHGQILTILEDSDSSDWVKVRISDGLTGWVAKKYVNYLSD